MKTQFRVLHWLASIFKVLSVGLFVGWIGLLILLGRIYFSDTSTSLPNAALSFVAALVTSAVVCLSLYGLGVLIEVVLAIEKNTRMTATILYKQFGEKSGK